MSVAVDRTMTKERFLDKYADVVINSTTSEDILHAVEMLTVIAPTTVYEVSFVSVPFDGYDIEVSHVHTPEGELIVTKNFQGHPVVVTYAGDHGVEFTYQMIVDAVTVDVHDEEEEEEIITMSFDTEEELIEFLSHLDIEVPEDWYV